MAYQGPQINIPGLTASADLSTKQFHFVKMSGNKTVTFCGAETDIPVGVLQNAPDEGEDATVTAIGVTKVSGDEDLDTGDLIGTFSDGQAQVMVAGTDTTKYIVGQVIDGNTTAGGLATAIVNCASPARAA